MKGKRLLALIVVALMLAALFGGCANDTTTPDDGSQLQSDDPANTPDDTKNAG